MAAILNKNGRAINFSTAEMPMALSGELFVRASRTILYSPVSSWQISTVIDSLQNLVIFNSSMLTLPLQNPSSPVPDYL